MKHDKDQSHPLRMNNRLPDTPLSEGGTPTQDPVSVVVRISPNPIWTSTFGLSPPTHYTHLFSY